MSILVDMLSALTRRRLEDAGPPAVPVDRLVFKVSAWDAYCADMARCGARYAVDVEGGRGEAFGVPVERDCGGGGFELVRVPR